VSASDQQAFPCINPSFDGNWDKRGVLQGMTMRQYYKAASLGFLERNIHGVSAEHLAARASEIADAMLAEDERHAQETRTVTQTASTQRP
jgi:hypothetical protein